MKKLLLIFGILFLLTGCGVDKAKVLTNLSNEYDKLKSFYIEGEMEVINNEESYKYNVTVSYKDNDYYKISLNNKQNNHEQIILKNSEGVFV